MVKDTFSKAEIVSVLFGDSKMTWLKKPLLADKAEAKILITIPSEQFWTEIIFKEISKRQFAVIAKK